VPEPSLAEKARTLMHVGRIGTLATNSRKHSGWPFGSMMPYALDSRGSPVFLVSSMAVHAQNLQADPRASLFVAQPGITGDPLGAARVTLMGEITPADSEFRELYLSKYENAQYWIDFDDFSLIRLDVRDVYFVGGFGIMGWVPADLYQGASPDPLADHAPRIIEDMNADHAAALVSLARVYAGLEAEDARMTSVDRLGFEMRLRTGERVHGTRVAFPEPALTLGECRTVLVEMIKRATSMPCDR
jgi:heme iron utilization protein